MDTQLSPEFPLIVANPDTLGGKPRIKGTRISVQHILEVIAHGADIPDIIDGWPELTPEAIEQAVRFAAAYLGTPGAAKPLAS